MSNPSMTEISVPRENVNDDSVRLLAWRVENRQPVSAGQVIAEIETSKATADVVSPTAGFLIHGASAGDEVPVGGVLGHVSDDAAAQLTAPSPVQPALVPAAVPAAVAVPPAPTNNGSHNYSPTAASSTSDAKPAETRISAKARDLMQRHNLDAAIFAGRGGGLVMTSDVMSHLGILSPSPAPSTPAPGATPLAAAPPAPVTQVVTPYVTSNKPAGSDVPVRTEQLARSKKIEGKYLSSGLRGTLASVITVACPTRGLRAACAEHPALQGQASALIIHEAARLLRKYPAFNAYHADGTINYYEKVNVGFAVDADKGLKVPVIHDADTKTPGQIADAMREYVVSYLSDSLAVEALSGGTFTVTDLSGDDVFGFHPLINQGQSAILGIGGEFFVPGSREGFFNLILAFDHQLSEGRAAARFLGDLKRRIVGYELALDSATPPKNNPVAEQPYCSWCMASAEELAELQQHLLQSVGADGKVSLLCSRCLLGHV